MFEEKPKTKKFTSKQAKLKAEHYCVYQERCQQEVRSKLYEWGLYSKDVESIIAYLIIENFLNEERFAKAYAGGKFRIKKWGRIKIKLELKKRNISAYCINSAMKEINEQDYLLVIKEILKKKLKEIKTGKQEVKNYKAANYIISRGFEPDVVWDCVAQMKG